MVDADPPQPGYLKTFYLESREWIARIEAAMVDLEQHPERAVEDLSEIRAVLHTLKGTAFMVGVTSIGELAHRLEDYLERFHGMETALRDDHLDAALGALDGLRHCLEAPEEDLTWVAPSAKGVSTQPVIAAQTSQIPHADASQTDVDEHVRVGLGAIDRLVWLTGDVALETKVLQDWQEELAALTRSARQLERELRTVAHVTLSSPVADHVRARQWQAAVASERLASQINRLWHRCEEPSRRLPRIGRQLNEAVLDLRLVHHSVLTEGLPRVVRQAARQREKDVALVVQAERAWVDRTLVPAVKELLVHLIRNAIAHGIELPAVRRDTGKSEQGIVTVELSSRQGTLWCTVRDDGVGINVERVRQRAEEMGLISSGDSLSEQETVRYIFHDSFSSSTTVDEVAGRGTGMDAVARRIRSLNGTLELQNEPGRGLAVHVRLPMPAASREMLLIRAGGVRFGVPLEFIASTGGFSTESDVSSDVSVQSRHLADVLGMDRCVDTEQDDTGRVDFVRLTLLTSDITLVVDAVEGLCEVLVRPLDPWTGHVPGVEALLMDAENRLAWQLDVEELATL